MVDVDNILFHKDIKKYQEKYRQHDPLSVKENRNKGW